MEQFTPYSALIGGALLGLAAAMLMYFQGRIAGISGILGGLLTPGSGDVGWRATFVAGLLAGGLVIGLLAPAALESTIDRSAVAIVAAGLLVGFGTRLGSGCTSGHGICGISRFSPRSTVATLAFMATGAGTAAVVTHVFGGQV
jgi:uncharacterized protein